jgi:hypothetical protein
MGIGASKRGAVRRRVGAWWAGAALASSVALAPGSATATVCEIDPSNLIGTPVSGGVHLGTLLTGGIGLAASGSQGWKTAAIVIASMNYVQSAALLTVDAMVQPSCGSSSELGPFNVPTLIAESVAIAATTGLLVAAVLHDPAEPPPPVSASPVLVPVEGGALAGVLVRF